MHLMSCENPQRVYNKYTGEYVWVACGKCNTCKCRHALKWTKLCENERSMSKYTFFVTLTYDELHLPKYNYGSFTTGEPMNWQRFSGSVLSATRSRDVNCIPFSDLKFETDADYDLFKGFMQNDGIPYASRSDIQLFHKRLNRYFCKYVTNQYKNFRYFLVSEFGSTTLRPHFHALYFVNDTKCAEHFFEGVSNSWQFGRIDCQFVEGTACSYVAQYVNKSADLPSFFQNKELRPWFVFSRNPLIGTGAQCTEDVQEIFDNGLVEVTCPQKETLQLERVPLHKTIENRLFFKCPFYRSITHSARNSLYGIARRFESKNGFKGFLVNVKCYLASIYNDFRINNILPIVTQGYYTLRLDAFGNYIMSLKPNDFSEFLRNQVDGFSETGINWLRRLYYLSRKVLSLCKQFGCSLNTYVLKVEQYWNNKELYLLRQFYQYQEDFMNDPANCVDDLALMYPEFLYNQNIFLKEYISQYEPKDVFDMRVNSEHMQFTNKVTHFKNMYLDSLRDKNNFMFNLLKCFYYAKKCNETLEAFAS